MDKFIGELRDFFDGLNIMYSESIDGNDSDCCLAESRPVSFLFPVMGLKVIAVPLMYFEMDLPNAAKALFSNRASQKTIFVYEDRWWSMGALVRSRLRAHLGLQKSIFARNCVVRRITAQTAAAFLDKYHIYGNTKAKYRYGLYRLRATGTNEIGMSESATLIAVATFSAPRQIARNNLSTFTSPLNDAPTISSCEWERYASLPEYRVIGGMGKMLKHFINEQHPDGIMSYADLEWSDGDVYSKLGFQKMEVRPAVHFRVDTSTMQRISKEKIGRDRRFRDETPKTQNSSSTITISNLGSQKYLLPLN